MLVWRSLKLGAWSLPECLLTWEPTGRLGADLEKYVFLLREDVTYGIVLAAAEAFGSHSILGAAYLF